MLHTTTPDFLTTIPTTRLFFANVDNDDDLIFIAGVSSVQWTVQAVGKRAPLTSTFSPLPQTFRNDDYDHNFLLIASD